jgi:hypothetical protein
MDSWEERDFRDLRENSQRLIRVLFDTEEALDINKIYEKIRLRESGNTNRGRGNIIGAITQLQNNRLETIIEKTSQDHYKFKPDMKSKYRDMITRICPLVEGAIPEVNDEIGISAYELIQLLRGKGINKEMNGRTYYIQMTEDSDTES